MTHPLKLAALFLAVSLSACGDTETTSTTMTEASVDTNATMGTVPEQTTAVNSMSDQDFVTKASSVNVAEVAAHKAAQSRAVTADVKMHAKHMLTDHQKMGDEMKALAAKKGMTVSNDPPPEKKQMLDDMNASKKGKDWDVAYVDAQVTEHNEAIALFERGSASAKDADLKALIDKTLPTLRDHLQMIKDAQSKMAK